ncbi:MAG: hypothetical protein LBD90_05175, partial [Bifidobacteriaceae bacterium]|nr:hypothetical protein [Bifidobacteriaceae bacterium]
STLTLAADTATLTALSNNGSLYWARSKDGLSTIFASEALILRRLLERDRWARAKFSAATIRQVAKGDGVAVDLVAATAQPFSFAAGRAWPVPAPNSASDLQMPDAARSLPAPNSASDLQMPDAVRNPPAAGFSLAAPTSAASGDKTPGQDGQAGCGEGPAAALADPPARARPTSVDVEPARPPAAGPALTHAAPQPVDLDAIHALTRCAKCVLPETMPFIEFDAAGVCNYCRTYTPETYLGADAAQRWAERVRQPDGRPDSLVAFSGGRDSSYGLHYMVRELGLKPIAFTYDWGMVTDLARRNQSRMCEQLGTELLIVSADIRRKRQNIRDNVAAWLKRPDLGLVPLFMAGDKQYFWYANEVARNYGLEQILLASNPFEKTHFKSGFCGVRPAQLAAEGAGEQLEHLALGAVARMAGHYAKQYARNPAYLNRSLLDTVGATASYYAIPHNYWRLFSYIPWVESEVDSTLLGLYDWETSPEAESTWRIGDGTAPWYNYIYYRVCGFTENDTLRSNQIREGQISRDYALTAIDRDNAPRYASMAWYFDAIGLDMWEALKVVDALPRRY